MAALLWEPPWDRAVGVTDCQWLFGCRCEIRCSVQILEAFLVPFPGRLGCSGVTEAGGWEGRGDSRCSSRVRQSRIQSLGCSVQEKVEAEATLCTVLKSKAEWGSRRLHCWQGKKPSQIIQTTKSHRRVSQSQKFQLRHYLGLPWTDRQTCGQDRQSSLFWLQKEQKHDLPFSLLCTTILHCTLHWDAACYGPALIK